MNARIYLICTFISLSTLSCTNPQKQFDSFALPNSNEYAEGFNIISHNNFKEVIVFSPWIKGSVYARYYLVNDNTTKTPENGQKVKIPLETLAATSVTHFEFLRLLGEIESVNAVCSPDIIYNPVIIKRLNEGKISNLGDAFNINIEKTLQLQPGAVMMSGYNQNDPYAQRVSQAGIPVLFNNEWMETSLLARAEWIKFVAAFYNKEAMADSIFGNIAQRYNEVKALAVNIEKKPTIMAGSNFRGTWYMPAGKNFMAQLFADAGGSYFYANDSTTGSLPLNVESVLRDFANTEIWLNCNFNSIDELIKSDVKHKLFKPVTSGQVYNFNKRLLPSTANDFWESAIARPDLLLSDVISILHPELIPGHETVYAEKLR
ncbi:MAG: ABC transporter substrate-binding protein [Paludibacteraceae bacterium]|nr:ABC transporter substrate-binding protein [Paludibacteraceae bacterium]